MRNGGSTAVLKSERFEPDGTAVTGERQLGEVMDYQSLLEVMRARADQLQLSRGSDDNAALAGLGDRYLSRLLAPNPTRKLGMKTMGAVLGLLQMKLIAVEDADAVR